LSVIIWIKAKGPFLVVVLYVIIVLGPGYIVVVIGCDDQHTESNKRVKGKYIGFVMNSTEYLVSSSNVMTRIVEMTGLSHSMFVRE